MKHVVIFQRRLVHYRLEFFERLRRALIARGIGLDLVVGRPNAVGKSRQDEASLAWATEVDVRQASLAGREIQWQPFPAHLRRCDLIVVTQENKIVSNYVHQIAALLGRRKLGLWGHGRNFQSEAPTGWLEAWKRFWLRRADWWFAYTEMSRRAVVESGFDPTRITVLNNTIDAEEFARDLQAVTAEQLNRFRAELGIAAQSPVMIHCGSLYADKRIDFMIAAADRLARDLPDFHLIVLGAGPEAATIEAAARERPWLHFLGMRKGAAKAVAFRAASVMLNPGLVGLHVIDSFVGACPIVTLTGSRHSPEIEYLSDGVNAVFVPSGSVDDYAKAIAQLFASPPRLAAMRESCRAAAEIYSLDAMVGNFADGIERALAA